MFTEEEVCEEQEREYNQLMEEDDQYCHPESFKWGFEHGLKYALTKLGLYPVSEPPIPGAPYISVVFCKGHNGWLPFTGYGCDISPKKTVEFINCINDAADVLNEKEE